MSALQKYKAEAKAGRETILKLTEMA